MPRVGDELLLLLGRFDDRVNGPARQKDDQHIDQREADSKRNARPDSKRSNRAQLLIAVEEDRDIAVFAFFYHAKFVAGGIKAVARAVLQGGLDIGVRIVLRHGGDVREISAVKISVCVKAQVKIARGVRRFGVERSSRAVRLARRLAVRLFLQLGRRVILFRRKLFFPVSGSCAFASSVSAVRFVGIVPWFS